MNLRLLIIVTFVLASSANVLGQCVGTPGQVSWQFWRGIDHDELAYLHVDDTYPLGPDGIRVLNSIASPYKYDDDFGSMIKGFLEVPESGNVTFNLTGDDETVFLLSTDAAAANLDTAASIIDGWTGREEFNKYPSQTSSAIAMTTGQLYYFEIHNKENGGGDHATLRWQRPYLTDSTWQDITSIYITDVCDPVCAPKGTPCDDSNANTTDDQWDGNCHCVGVPTANNQNVGDRGVLQAYFYDDVNGGNINSLMVDPTMPSVPNRMVLQHTGLNIQWEDDIDNYGALIQGLLVVPETGTYDFNITGVRQVRFNLSSDHTEANKEANMIETLWGTGRLEHDDPAFNGSQTMTNITLQANTYYYFEFVQAVSTWGHRASVFWRGGHYPDNNWHHIPEIMLFDYTAELACLPQGAPCNDGDPFTANDQIIHTIEGGMITDCYCEGTPCTPFVNCDDSGSEYVKYDYCETTDALGNRADDAWLSCIPQANPYLEERSGYHWIHYDLGQQYYIKETHVWNFNVPGQTNQGFQNVAVDYSVDGLDWYHLGNYSWSLASGENTYTGFDGPDFNDVTARYIMFTSLDSPVSCRGIHKITFNVGLCEDEGTICDDGNALTYNDHIDADCQCVGYTAAELDCAKDTLFITESDMDPNSYHAMMALMSEGKVMNAANVNYKAGLEIVLDEGFEVTMGSTFEVLIEDCASPILAAVPAKSISPGLKKPIRPEESLNVYTLEGHPEQTVHFYLPEPSAVSLEIIDQEGNLVSPIIRHNYDNFGDHYKRIQTKKLAPGIYFIRMTTETNTYLEKMVVM